MMRMARAVVCDRAPVEHHRSPRGVDHQSRRTRSQGDDHRGRSQGRSRAEAVASADGHLRSKGAPFVSNDSEDDEYQLEANDVVSIEDGTVYYDGPDARPARSRPTAGQPKGRATEAKRGRSQTCAPLPGDREAARFSLWRALSLAAHGAARRQPSGMARGLRSGGRRTRRSKAVAQARSSVARRVARLQLPTPRSARLVTPASRMPHGTMPAKWREVGRDVEAEAVRAHPARQPHADGRDLVVAVRSPLGTAHPDADAARPRARRATSSAASASMIQSSSARDVSAHVAEAAPHVEHDVGRRAGRARDR